MCPLEKCWCARRAQVMGGIDGAAEAEQARWVQRQACMSIRNIVVRCPDLRPVVLSKVPTRSLV